MVGGLEKGLFLQTIIKNTQLGDIRYVPEVGM